MSANTRPVEARCNYAATCQNKASQTRRHATFPNERVKLCTDHAKVMAARFGASR